MARTKFSTRNFRSDADMQINFRVCCRGQLLTDTAKRLGDEIEKIGLAGPENIKMAIDYIDGQRERLCLLDYI